MERSIAPENLTQLHQWQLWREERGAAWPPLPPELVQRCRAAFSSKDGVPSRLQRDVVASLQALGLAPREERERRSAPSRATGLQPRRRGRVRRARGGD